MIARTWRGAVRAEDADAYLDVLRATGQAAFRATPGNLGFFTLRRIVGDRAELLVVSLWDSMEAVRRFAGLAPEQAVFYPEDGAFLIERDLHVDHYDVVDHQV
jgi:heme-degrading monooxygenase HmoA